MEHSGVLPAKKRLVIKVGTAVLTQDGQLAIERMGNLVDLIAKLKNEKKIEVILVSSGAVGAGYTSLKLDKKIIANKQALAAIGQPLLLNIIKKDLLSMELFVLKCYLLQMILTQEKEQKMLKM